MAAVHRGCGMARDGFAADQSLAAVAVAPSGNRIRRRERLVLFQMAQPTVGTIEVRVRELRQLFNSLDPSPFHERDLDDEAETYIVAWAQEFPRHARLRLVIHLVDVEPAADDAESVAAAFSHYFRYRREVLQKDLRELFRTGRTALAIGAVLLSSCLFLAHALRVYVFADPVGRIVEESLLIFGWVSTWRPAEIFLYDWWPLARRRDLYGRLSQADVELRSEQPRGVAMAPPADPTAATTASQSQRGLSRL